MDLTFHLCCAGFLEIWPRVKVVGVWELGEGWRPVAHCSAFQSHRRQMAGQPHGVVGEQTRRLDPSLVLVPGKTCSLPTLDLAGPAATTLQQLALSPLSKNLQQGRVFSNRFEFLGILTINIFF